MEYYFFLKWLHILTAALLFGTGLGIAFFMFVAHLSKNIITLKNVTRFVIWGDLFFTTPSVILQPITGIWLMLILHYPFNSLWFLLTITLYCLIGLCWIPVVFIQYRLHHCVITLAANETLPLTYHSLMRWWICLGIPAFIMVMVLYWLMITKPGLTILLF